MTALPASVATNSNKMLITTIDATTKVMVPKDIQEKEAMAADFSSAGVASASATTETASSSSTTTEVEEINMNETPEEREERIRLTHELLARQLEYYFSVANLSRDTYVSTLRDLNDGYVPLSIIANFGKVQALAPYESALDAVCNASIEYSDLLEMVELDEKGKKLSVLTTEKIMMNNEEGTTKNIWAVGTVTGQPIPQSQIQSSPHYRRRSSNDEEETSSTPTDANIDATNVTAAKTIQPPTAAAAADTCGRSSPNNNPSSSPTQNTIILREVSEDVEETVIRSIFNFDGCPSIQSVHLDLHNCWFVTLNTSSRDDMVNAMMKLRTLKFPSGDPVKARLKSSAPASTPSPLSPHAVVYTHPNVSGIYAPRLYGNGNNGDVGSSSNGAAAAPTNGNGRKKRSSNNNKKRNNSNRDGNGSGGVNGNNTAGVSRSSNSSGAATSNQQGGAGNGNRRYEKDESSARPTPSSSSSSSYANNNSNSNYYNRNNRSTGSGGSTGRSKKNVGVQPPPPSMGEVNFPSLPPTTDGNSKPFQVEKVPTEDEMLRNHGDKGRSCSSDASSTATTTSSSLTLTEDNAPRGVGAGSTGSSTGSNPIVTGGYAAALLRPAAKIPIPPAAATTRKTTKQITTEQKKGKQQQQKKSKDHQSKQGSSTKGAIAASSKSKNAIDDDDEPVVVTIQPPSWGRGSFAAILAEKA